MTTKTGIARKHLVRIETAKHDPASVYKRPKDVLDDETLTRHEKIDILRRWAYDEREIAVAEEENMLCEGPEQRDNILDEVLKSLIKLGVDSDQEDPPPTKHG